MSDWTEVFEQHEVHTTLQSLNDRLDSSDLETTTTEEDDLVGRIRLITTHVEAVLSNAIPGITPAGVLNKINTAFTSIISELNNFIANGNSAHLNNTSSHISQAINHVNTIPLAIQGGGKLKSYTSFFAAIKRQYETIIDDLRDSSATLDESFQELTGGLENQELQLQALEKSLVTQAVKRDEVVSSFQEEFNSSKANFKADFESTKGEFEKEINISQAEFQSAMEDLNFETKEVLEELMSAQVEKFEKQREEKSKKADELLETIKDKDDQASKLLEAIGNTGITGNYQKRAAREGVFADNWRRMSILFWLLLIATMIFTIWASQGVETDWHIFLFRMIAGLFFALPATYSAKESSKHRKLEGYYRQRELELASLGPFLELMDASVRDKIRETLAGLYFGQEPRFVEDHLRGTNIPVPRNFVQKLLDALTKG